MLTPFDAPFDADPFKLKSNAMLTPLSSALSSLFKLLGIIAMLTRFVAFRLMTFGEINWAPYPVVPVPSSSAVPSSSRKQVGLAVSPRNPTAF